MQTKSLQQSKEVKAGKVICISTQAWEDQKGPLEMVDFDSGRRARGRNKRDRTRAEEAGEA